MDPRRVVATSLMVACFVIFCVVAVSGIFMPDSVTPAMSLVSIVGMFILTLASLLLSGDSEHIRARQTNRTLGLASETVSFMRQGLTIESAQEVCELLLPASLSDAVAITDREKVLGFAGVDKGTHEPNTPIQTQMTRDTLEDGQARIGVTANAVGFRKNPSKLRAGIVAPLTVNGHVMGTLKFYYKSPRKVTEAQKAMVEGFAQLLSTQLSLSYLQQQTELAAKMELKALQAQINPHFLFNTINTIAAIVRTDPAKARTMLREFAIYYRRLLENSEDLIPLSKEIEQTERYLMFQRARFGEDQILMDIDVEPGLENLNVPSFILQPIVENAVGHGRREEGALHIVVKVYHASESVVISIADDGLGIEPERLDNLIDGGSKTGMGIALKNVNMRLKAYFGTVSGIYIDSTLGEGTTVYLSLYDALVTQRLLDDDYEDDGIIEEPAEKPRKYEPVRPVGAAIPYPHPHQ